MTDVELIANADAVMYTVPNPQRGQPPVPRAAHRGETFTVGADEAKRLLAIDVNRDYELGGGRTFRQVEPAVVTPGETPGLSGVEAVRKAKAAELREQLAALESGPTAAEVAAVSLTPTAEDDPDAPRPVTDDPAKAGGKAPAPGGK